MSELLLKRCDFMKKILFVATVQEHIAVFHKPIIEMLQKKGYEVHVCGKNNLAEKNGRNLNGVDKVFDVPFERSPFSLKNIKAYKMLKKIIKENNYDIVQCNTPVGGVLARLASRKLRKSGTKVVYTAHGFHFFKGAPLINWLIYFPVEWIFSFVTDVLITINKEDYNRAKKYFHAKKTEYIPGVGIECEKIENIAVSREEKRKEVGILENETAVLSVGELNDNKNHETIIKAISKTENNKNIVYVICGNGNKKEDLEELSKKLNVNLKLLGYRSDVFEICKACDIFAFPSKREGFGLASIEAMMCGLPLVTSNIHGIVDYSQNDYSGYNCSPTDVNSFAKNIEFLINNPEKRKEFGENNKKTAKNYDVKNVLEKMKKIFEELEEKNEK